MGVVFSPYKKRILASYGVAIGLLVSVFFIDDSSGDSHVKLVAISFPTCLLNVYADFLKSRIEIRSGKPPKYLRNSFFSLLISYVCLMLLVAMQALTPGVYCLLFISIPLVSWLGYYEGGVLEDFPLEDEN